MCLQILTNELRGSTEGKGWAADASDKLSLKKTLILAFSPRLSLAYQIITVLTSVIHV